MTDSNLRKPAVAGTFYPAQDSSLRSQIESAFTHRLGPGVVPQVNVRGPRQIVGLVCPHAGYVYSGPLAAHAYAALANDGKPDLAILIGPSHRASRAEITIDSFQHWQTPLGSTLIDIQMAQDIKSNCPSVEIDSTDHVHEHSLEVQLPFLQFVYGDSLRIVPILMAVQDLRTSSALGRAIAVAGKHTNLVVIASTDLTHYEPQNKAVQADQHVLDAIVRIAPADLLRTVSKEHITMCGPGPVAAMLVAGQMLGAVRAKILSYATSGDVSGDYSRVVGYCAAEATRSDRH